jgi:hypothetical protein
MIRKKCFAAFAAIAVLSCSEKNADLPCAEENAGLVTFSVSVPVLDTKSTGSSADGERTINSLQVFVFNHHGVYETSAVADKGEVEITCTAGQKKMVALVNANEEYDVTDYESLAERPVYLKDSGVGDLVMLGDTTVAVAADKPIDIEVSYLSSKVVLESVKLNLANPEHESLDFAVTSVFLTNVAGDRKYINDSDPSVWYHEGADLSKTLPFIYDSVSGGVLDPDDSDGYAKEHYFYCYPNATATRTRLVIETSIGGETYYYPITLTELLPNNQYSYSVVLTRLGTDSPDGSLEEDAYGVTVSIKGWTTNSSTVVI